MIESQNLLVAKELKDVAVLLKDIVACIKAKGDYAKLLPELITAIDGLGQIDDEFKANLEVCFATMGYELLQIPAILMKKVEVIPAV